MKSNKSILIALLACISLFFSSLSLAEEAKQVPYGEKIGLKTLRGLSNVSLSILEVPKNIINISNESNIIFGASAGLLLGTVNTFGRIAVGALDLITFPLATKPIVQPIHPWQNYFEVETEYQDIFDLDF